MAPQPLGAAGALDTSASDPGVNALHVPVSICSASTDQALFCFGA